MSSPRYVNKIASFDWITLALYISLVSIGWLMIYASVHSDTLVTSLLFDMDSLVGKQTLWIGISLFILLLTQVIDPRFWRVFAYQISLVCILLLVLVLLFGHTAKGATSWFSVAGFTMQPSEFAKFGTCLALGSLLSFYRTDLLNIKYQFTAVAIILVPVALILLQPDAGSALVFFSFFIVLFRAGMPPLPYVIVITLVLLFIFSFIMGPPYVTLVILWLASVGLGWVSGVKPLYLISALFFAFTSSALFLDKSNFLLFLSISVLGLLIALAYLIIKKKNPNYVAVIGVIVLASAFSFGTNYAFDHLLKPHQKDRINVWLKPEKCDPKGALYNILQSKMAIGSGGLQGKGFLKGTMSKLNYVPEQSTDFIFTVIGEEQGFVGSFSIIILFGLLIFRIIYLGEQSESQLNLYYAYGLAGLLFIHCSINIGMTVGLFPVIGIPLPFISYGGSSMVGFTLLVGVFLKLCQKT